MWIRLLLCTTDTTYRERLVAFLERKYGDKIEVTAFPDLPHLLDSIKSKDADLILFGEEMEDEILPAMKNLSCTYAVLMKQLYTSEGEDSVNRIAKYRSGDELYKAAVEVYSKGDKVRQVHPLAEGEAGTVYVFFSPGGGVGTTTVAKAYAEKCAEQEKVLYLDFHPLSASWLEEEKEHGMDDIIMGLKSRRDILPLKLVSAVAQNRKSVYTYAPCKDSRNLLGISTEDIERLIEGIRTLGEYRRIIFDVGNSLTQKEIELFRQADQLVCVVEEKETVGERYRRLCMLFENLERGGREENDGKIRIFRKLAVFRNKVLDGNTSGWGGHGVRVIGWAPKVSEGSEEAVIERIRQSDAFDDMEIKDARQCEE